MCSMAQPQHATGSRVPGIRGCRADTPVCALISNAARSHEYDVGVVSPIGTFSRVVGAAHTSGAGEGWGQAAALSSLSVFVKYCVLHKLAEGGDRAEGNESALSTQLQNKYKTPRAGPLPS